MFNALILTMLFFASSSRCFAERTIENVSKERAKELGMVIRSNAAGPKDVWVQLEFKIKGELKGYWAVTVRANWRVIFRFADGDALEVDYVEYH